MRQTDLADLLGIAGLLAHVCRRTGLAPAVLRPDLARPFGGPHSQHVLMTPTQVRKLSIRHSRQTLTTPHHHPPTTTRGATA
jgi:hypothetical protein